MANVTPCNSGPFPATTCTIPSTANGNLIVVAWSSAFGTMPTISSVTDNAGNTYTAAGSARAVDATANQMVDIWYAKNSKAGATTVAITPSPSGNVGAAVIWEFANVDTVSPLDKTAVLNSQLATSMPIGASVTPSAPASVVVSVMVPGGAMTGLHAGNAFTNDSLLYGVGWAHLITTATGTYSAQWDASGTYASSTVSFKAASSAPNFTVSALPVSRTVTAGTSAAYTVSVTPSGGFGGSVSLNVSGLPAGAAASFTPGSITTSGSSTLTISSTSSTPPSTYTLMITGTSGGLTQTTAATLAVTNFTGPNACDVNKDGSANVVDVQVAKINYFSCPGPASQTFYSQVITGALGVCPVTAGIHTVSLNWTASTTSGVTYNVYRATTSGGYNYSTPLNPGPISGTSFTDCNVALGQTYYYVIKASAGGNESVATTEIQVTIPPS